MWKHSTENIKDIVITACEGGVNYWAKVGQYDPDNGTATLLEIDYDYNPPQVIKRHKLTPAIVRKGIRLALQSEHEHIRRIAVSDDIDAEEADVLVQLGLLGEIVYG